jgi:hypothetical protein
LDYPAVQPLYSTVFLGAGKAWGTRRARVINTVAVIAGFASFFVDDPIHDGLVPNEDAPKRQGFKTGMGEHAYVEKNQAWNSAGFMVY